MSDRASASPRRSSIALALAAGAAVALLPVASDAQTPRGGSEARAPLWTEGTLDPIVRADEPMRFDAFRRLAARAAPAVVSIETGVSRGALDMMGPLFGRRGDGTIPFGAGSGFIIRADGYLLSNNHVVEDAEVIKVHLQDGRVFEAKRVGQDPATDLSLLKIEPGDEALPVVPFGDSDALAIGDWVVAIGNPMGLSHTVTAGIVSAKGRREVRPDRRLRYADFIQTDASINPGNSGGPLFNLRGEVIGINTAINAQAQGIGFAVPINMVKTILPSLRRTGRVERSWLGVQIEPVSPKQAERLGFDRPKGAMVAMVVADGPAARAGIKVGDVILQFADEKIDRHDDLPWLASNAGVGSTVPVSILRRGKERVVRITLGRLPGESPRRRRRPRR